MARDDVNFDIHARDKTQRAFDSAGRGLKSLKAEAGAAFAGVAAVAATAGAAFAVFASSVIDAGDEIQKMGLRTGASTEWLSQMEQAVKLGGGSMSDFAGAMRKMQKSVADAGDGLSTQVRAFSALGIEINKFKALSPEQQFDVLADALMNIEDPAKRTQVAMDIMGRSGSQMLSVMQGGSAALVQLRAAADAAGQTLSQSAANDMAEYNDEMTKLQDSATASGRTLVEAMLPTLITIAKWLGEYLPATIESFLQGWAKFRKGVIVTSVVVLDQFRKLYDALSHLPGSVGDFYAGAAAGLKSFEQSLISAHGEIQEFYKVTVPDTGAALKKNAEILSDVYNPAMRETVGAANEAAKAHNDLKREAQSVFASTRTPLERYNAELEKLNKLLAEGAISQDTYERATKKAQEGFDVAAKKGSEAAGAQADVWGTATSALEGYVNSGKLDLDSLKDAGIKAVMSIAESWLTQKAGMSGGSPWGVGGASGGGGFDLGGIFDGVGSMLSFAGGGSTGNGPRSGGLDGQGGFLAVMHPKERVIDNTRSGGGNATGGVTVVYNIDARGADMGVEAVIRRVLREEEPNTIGKAVRGAVTMVEHMSNQGGSFAQAMGRR